MFPGSKRQPFLAAGAISVLALVGASPSVLAQQESPAAESPSPDGAAATAHPLHIHSGTCDQLGDVVFPLGEVSTDLMINGEAAGNDMVGSVTEQDVALNVTVVAATIADLTSNDHAINIHRSEDAMDDYIACGDIGGTLIGGDSLVIRLNPLNDSGYIGFALFQEGDDGNTTVYSMLTDTGAMTGSMDGATDQSPEGSPAASMAPESMAPESMAPESMAPESMAPESMAPESMAPESMAPESSLMPDGSLMPNGSLMPDSSLMPESSMDPSLESFAPSLDPSLEPDVIVEVTVNEGDDVAVDVNQEAEQSPAA